jgi:hypothetical protein
MVHGKLVELDVVDGSPLPTFSTLRTYTVCTTSRVAGSMQIGPRGLLIFMPLSTAIALSPSILPFSFATW